MPARTGEGPPGRSGSSRTVQLLRAIAVVAATLLAAVAVVLGGAVRGILRTGPLRSPAGWARFGRGPARAASRRSTRPLLTEPSVADRIRRVAVVAVVVVTVAVVTPLGRAGLELFEQDGPTTDPFRLADEGDALADASVLREPVPPGVEEHWPGPDEPIAALANSPWFQDPAYNTAQGWAFESRAIWRPVTPYRLRDFRSKYLNVVDGRRLTWKPPLCDCQRLTVWMYGGSTTYGLDQRDEHTIASYLGRIAYEHGLTVDVENRGELGQLHWLEAERLAIDLTIDDPPDLVVFYDGVNDMWSTGALANRKVGDVPFTIDPTLIDVWNSADRSAGEMPAGPVGSRYLGWEQWELAAPLSTPAMAELTVARYDRSRELSRTTAAAHGVEVRYFWQPSRVSRPLVPSEPHSDTDGENYARLHEQMTRDALTDGVVDLGDSLDVTDEPLFSDDVHHNELGARLVAEAMYAHLEDDLMALG